MKGERDIYAINQSEMSQHFRERKSLVKRGLS